MKKNKLFLTLVVVAAAVGVNAFLIKRMRHKKKLAVVSDAGYETAFDIHFPLKYKKAK